MKTSFLTDLKYLLILSKMKELETRIFTLKPIHKAVLETI